MVSCNEVMLSIRPHWCYEIIRGRKDLEIRRNKPKLQTPFKCYIYCTKDDGGQCPLYGLGDECLWLDGERTHYASQEVIAEFTCDEIIQVYPYMPNMQEIERRSCLTNKQIFDYLLGPGYGWHIKDLKIYKPTLKVSDFCNGSSVFTFDKDGRTVYTGMKRAPQSWGYVEKVYKEV